MGKSLVIVESPSKAAIINRYLGDGYIVRASVGHIRDLPVKSSGSGTKAGVRTVGKGGRGRSPQDKQQALAARMGVDPYNGWKADYEIMPGKEKVVAELRKLSRDADKIFLATDLDREGEAIAWHLREVLGGDESRYLRVKYPEITRAAITRAFENPGQIDMSLVNAQQTRRFLDRVVGFMVSPLLWKKVARGLSAGRVQSVAVELIVDREREIRAFVPEEYWTVAAKVKTPRGDELILDLCGKNGSKFKISSREQAEQVRAELQNLPFNITRVESRQGKQHPLPPFITSTLQQAANQRLGFSVRRTMTTAQHLYERGLITYMRTDSVNLSREAIKAARELISGQYGSAYLPDTPNYYKSRQSAQEAHEAIRPSHPGSPLPADVDRDGQRLYGLIAARYLACQMTPQVYESTSVQAEAGPYNFKALGRRVLFDGFRRVWNSGGTEENLLPEVHAPEPLALVEVKAGQHFTQPPVRFSEAGLVRELEKDGIGRPSTYASIISTIQERGYVKLENKRFYAEVMGEIVTDRLRYSFRDLMDTSFTASMENELDEIAQGQADWRDILDKFYRNFDQELSSASRPAADGGMPENEPLELKELTCPKCGKYHMAVQSGKTGTFLCCLGYYDRSVPPGERCTKTMDLTGLDLVSLKSREISEEEEAEILRKRPRCEKCGSVMNSFMVNEHLKLHLCGTPNCRYYQLEEGNFGTEFVTGPEIQCERCGQKMVLKSGRFGKFMACTNPECGNTRKILKNGKVAPPREAPVELPELPCQAAGAHFVLRDGAAGIFLSAHNFPKVRESRAPKVAELKRFRERLPEKFHYLCTGPETDPGGNEVEVRFSRKTRKQYLMGVKPDGKSSGFVAFYNEEKQVWEPQERKASGKASATRKGRGRKGSSIDKA